MKSVKTEIKVQVKELIGDEISLDVCFDVGDLSWDIKGMVRSFQDLIHDQIDDELK